MTLLNLMRSITAVGKANVGSTPQMPLYPIRLKPAMPKNVWNTSTMSSGRSDIPPSSWSCRFTTENNVGRQSTFWSAHTLDGAKCKFGKGCIATSHACACVCLQVSLGGYGGASDSLLVPTCKAQNTECRQVALELKTIANKTTQQACEPTWQSRMKACSAAWSIQCRRPSMLSADRHHHV